MAALEELTPHSLSPSSPKSHSPVINAQTKSKQPRPSTNASAEEELRQAHLLDSIRTQQALVRSLVRAFLDLCFLSKSTKESLANHTSDKFHSRRCSLANLETTGEPTFCPSWPRKPCGRSTQKLVPRYAAAEENGLAAPIPTRRPARLSLFCTPGPLTWPRSTAPRHPKRVWQLPLLRLQCALSSMGIPQVRYFHMLVVRGRPPGTGCTHQLRPIHLHGRFQADRD